MKPYVHKVQYYETDKMQFTHHSNYIRFMEEARTDFLEQVGYPYKRIESEGIFSPVIGVNVSYKKPTTYADEIEIDVKLKDMSLARCEFEYVMTCKGEVVCIATSQHCFLDETGRPVSPKRKNPEFYQKMLSLCEK